MHAELEVTAEAQRLAEQGRSEEGRGAFTKALECYDRAIRLLDGSPPGILATNLLRWKGNALLQLGRTPEAGELYRQSLAAAEALEYESGWAHGLNCLGALAQRLGRMEQAEALYHEAALRAVRAGERRLQGMVEHNLGILANIRGDFDAALVRYRMSLKSLEEVGDRAQVAQVLNDLGMLQTDQRRFEEAERAYGRGLEIARQLGDRLIEGVIELNRAEMYSAAERWEEAERACMRSLLIAEERNDPLRRAEALRIRALIEQDRCNFETVASVLDEALELARGVQDVLLCAEVMREMGEMWRRRGDKLQAKTNWQDALERFTSIGARRDAGEVEGRLASLAA